MDELMDDNDGEGEEFTFNNFSKCIMMLKN